MSAKKLIVTASLLHIAAYLYAAPTHAIDPSWPAHAKFHIVQAIFWILGLDCVALILALRALPKASKWTLSAFAVVFLTAHLAYFIAMLVIPAGRPPEMSSHLALGFVMLVYLLGLIQAYRNREL